MKSLRTCFASASGEQSRDRQGAVPFGLLEVRFPTPGIASRRNGRAGAALKRYAVRRTLVAAVAIAALTGCGSLANLTASLGGSTAGDRGTIRVLLINNTTEQAVFSVATYDQLDQESRPDIEQFGLGASDRPLNGGESSDPISINCGRTLAIGSPRLIELANENLTDTTLDPFSLIEGVDFYASVDGDPVDDAVDEPAIVGSALPFEARLGVDFPCNGLVIIRFEFDDAGDRPYRIDFEVVPSETTR